MPGIIVLRSNITGTPQKFGAYERGVKKLLCGSCVRVACAGGNAPADDHDLAAQMPAAAKRILLTKGPMLKAGSVGDATLIKFVQ